MKSMKPSILLAALAAFAIAAVTSPLQAQTGAPSSGPESVYELAKLSIPPKPIKQGPPTYPYELRKNKVQGEALISFIVGKDGMVHSAEVKRTNHELFGIAAAEAVMGWQFIPGQLNGMPVNSRMMVPIVFSIN